MVIMDFVILTNGVCGAGNCLLFLVSVLNFFFLARLYTHSKKYWATLHMNNSDTSDA